METPKRRVLDWTHIETWLDVVVNALLVGLPPTKDRSWLASLPSASMCAEDSGRLAPIVAESNLADDEHLCAVFASRLPVLFDDLRCVHLCRPVDFESYRKRGLVRLDPAAKQKDLIEFFASHHPDVHRLDIQQAISKVSAQYREDRVYFGIDERWMLAEAADYSKFGSEYQLAIANKIIGDGRTDYRQCLRLRGRPAYVVVHLPMVSIESGIRADLARALLEAALWAVQLDKDHAPRRDFSFSIANDVPSEMISDIVPVSERATERLSENRDVS